MSILEPDNYNSNFYQNSLQINETSSQLAANTESQVWVFLDYFTEALDVIYFFFWHH